MINAHSGGEEAVVYFLHPDALPRLAACLCVDLELLGKVWRNRTIIRRDNHHAAMRLMRRVVEHHKGRVNLRHMVAKVACSWSCLWILQNDAMRTPKAEGGSKIGVPRKSADPEREGHFGAEAGSGFCVFPCVGWDLVDKVMGQAKLTMATKI
jgi:hypothetical protein